jgi:DNA-binding NtrC family response regulator
LISVAARGGSPVTVWGEPGTGKKLVARSIHARSPRREGPFLVVPCTSLPGLIREAEARSMETGEGRVRDDWFWAAEGGTLVLEGVDALPISAQSTLLRVLLRAAGERRPRLRRTSDWKPRGVRLVCVARENPLKWIGERGFLEPLFFRLATTQIRTPPLAEREGDLYMLVCHFLRELTPTTRTAPGLTPAAWKELFAHTFAGNLRELEWVLEQALASAGGGEIDVSHLPESFGRSLPA